VEGPTSVDDMVYTLGDPEMAKRTDELSNKMLVPFGLSWNDVEDVISIIASRRC